MAILGCISFLHFGLLFVNRPWLCLASDPSIVLLGPIAFPSLTEPLRELWRGKECH
ncbi:mCG140306, isoform CRA_a [Mus musculus]|nr:mCG140306, isoform CRA_a [Mus musculus]